MIGMVKGLEGKLCDECLRPLGLSSLEKTEGRAQTNIPMEGSRGLGTDLFALVTSDRIRGNGRKREQGRLR